jgi:SAM-dependent methyltransferase
MTMTLQMNELVLAAREQTQDDGLDDAAERDVSFRGAMAEGWDEGGQLQLNYLIAAGLQPQNRVLDLGCGALRGGGRIIGYLNDANYFGIDVDKRLLNIGHREELGPLGLQEKCPRRNLYCSGMFRHERLPDMAIDVGLCVSVMRELPLNFLRVMLENAAPYFRPGGVLHLSYFELGAAKHFGQPYTNMARHKTFGFKPPYHYYRRDIEQAAVASPWDCQHAGDWQHPDGEVMMMFIKR